MILAATGHRNKYWPCKYDTNNDWYKSLVSNIKSKLIELAPELVITGGAIGFDMEIAEAALNLGIEHHLYKPTLKQGINWPKRSRNRLNAIANSSSEVILCSEYYYPAVFLIRDKMMVDAADQMIALLSPDASNESGTFQTVEMAIKQNKKVHNIWEFIGEE